MTRAINFLLCVAILSGLGALIREQSKLTKLRVEYDQLAQKYGVLEVEDPKKYYVKRIQTEYEKDFLWRFYKPDGISLAYRCAWGSGGSSSGSSSATDGGEIMYRCRLVFDGSTLQVHHLRANGSGRSGTNSKVLAKFVDEHWSELEIETIADGEHSADEILSFVTIRIPPALVSELVKLEGGKRYKSLRQNALFRNTYGTKEAYAAAKEKKEGQL